MTDTNYNDFFPDGIHQEDYFDPIRLSWLRRGHVQSDIYVDGITGKFYTEKHEANDNTNMHLLTLIDKYVLNWQTDVVTFPAGEATELEPHDEPAISYPLMAWENQDDADFVCELMNNNASKLSHNPGKSGKWFVSHEKLPIDYPQDNVFTYVRSADLDADGQAQIDILNQQIANLHTQLQQALDQAQQANAEKNQALANLATAQQTVATLTDELADANTTIQNLTAENATLAQEYQTANANYLQYYNLYLTTNTQLQTAEGQILTLQQQVADLTTQNGQLQSENTQLTDQIGVLNQQIAGLQQQVADLTAQVGILQQQVATAHQQAEDFWQKLVENANTIAKMRSDKNTENTGLVGALNSMIASTFTALGLHPTAGVPTMLLGNVGFDYWQPGDNFPDVNELTFYVPFIEGWSQNGAPVSISDINFYDPAHILTNADGSGKMFYNIQDFYTAMKAYVASLGYSSVSVMGQAVAGLQDTINNMQAQINALQVKAGYWDTVKTTGTKPALFRMPSAVQLSNPTMAIFTPAITNPTQVMTGMSMGDFMNTLMTQGDGVALLSTYSAVIGAPYVKNPANWGVINDAVTFNGAMAPYNYPDSTDVDTRQVIPAPSNQQTTPVYNINAKGFVGISDVLSLYVAPNALNAGVIGLTAGDATGQAVFKAYVLDRLDMLLMTLKYLHSGNNTTGFDFRNVTSPNIISGAIPSLVFENGTNMYQLLNAINGMMAHVNITDDPAWSPATYVYSNLALSMALGVRDSDSPATIQAMVTAIQALPAQIITDMVNNINSLLN